jgi:hypothetical protein
VAPRLEIHFLRHGSREARGPLFAWVPRHDVRGCRLGNEVRVETDVVCRGTWSACWIKCDIFVAKRICKGQNCVGLVPKCEAYQHLVLGLVIWNAPWSQEPW